MSTTTRLAATGATPATTVAATVAHMLESSDESAAATGTADSFYRPVALATITLVCVVGSAVYRTSARSRVPFSPILAALVSGIAVRLAAQAMFEPSASSAGSGGATTPSLLSQSLRDHSRPLVNAGLTVLGLHVGSHIDLAELIPAMPGRGATTVNGSPVRTVLLALSIAYVVFACGFKLLFPSSTAAFACAAAAISIERSSAEAIATAALLQAKGPFTQSTILGAACMDVCATVMFAISVAVLQSNAAQGDASATAGGGGALEALVRSLVATLAVVAAVLVALRFLLPITLVGGGRGASATTTGSTSGGLPGHPSIALALVIVIFVVVGRVLHFELILAAMLLGAVLGAVNGGRGEGAGHPALVAVSETAASVFDLVCACLFPLIGMRLRLDAIARASLLGAVLFVLRVAALHCGFFTSCSLNPQLYAHRHIRAWSALTQLAIGLSLVTRLEEAVNASAVSVGPIADAAPALLGMVVIGMCAGPTGTQLALGWSGEAGKAVKTVSQAPAEDVAVAA